MPIDPIIHPRQLLDYYNYMYLVTRHGWLEKKRIVGAVTAPNDMIGSFLSAT